MLNLAGLGSSNFLGLMNYKSGLIGNFRQRKSEPANPPSGPNLELSTPQCTSLMKKTYTKTCRVIWPLRIDQL